MPDLQILLTITEVDRVGVTHARTKFNASVPATVKDENDNDIPNPALITSDEDYVLARIQGVVDSWKAQAVLDNTPLPPPPPSPSVINGIPQMVSRRQARQALIQAGKFDLVQPAIDSIPNATQRAMMQSEWDDSLTFQRSRPALIQMGLAIGLTSTDLDNLFILAATL
jgi:hypothetical protein